MKNYIFLKSFPFILLFINLAFAQNNPFSQSKFVPDISLIIDASYFHHNLKNHEYEELIIPGISHKHFNEDESHNHATVQKGFNFNYGELYISSIVDPFFDLTGVFHLSRSGFEIEEGYFITRKLPLGFQLKGGKFYSGFGKINEQHQHIWDFVDQPLVYKSFFGPEGLNEVGLQLNWIAPTNFFLNFGFEILEGENESSFGKTGFNTETITVEPIELPNLYIGYLKSSLDIDNFTGLLQLSGASGKSRLNHGIESTIDADAISANTKIFGISLTGKYLVDPIRSLTLQTEYLYRITQGNKYTRDSTGIQLYDLKKYQSGIYAQIIYKFAQRWRFGIRYEFLNNNSIKLDGIEKEQPSFLPRYSTMIDFNPTEFSRIRLQYSYDRSRYSFEEDIFAVKDIHQIMLQINLSIGAHGAHPF